MARLDLDVLQRSAQFRAQRRDLGDDRAYEGCLALVDVVEEVGHVAGVGWEALEVGEGAFGVEQAQLGLDICTAVMVSVFMAWASVNRWA